MKQNVQEAKKGEVLPSAQILSRSPGRLRLKIWDHRLGKSYFEKVVAAMRLWDGILRVEAHALTGSLLIFHRLTEEAIFDKAAAHALFLMKKDISQTSIEAKKSRKLGLNQRSLNEDLSGVAGVTLLGLTMLQATRGKFLPAGLTLIFQASEFLRTWHLRPLPSHLEPLSEGL